MQRRVSIRPRALAEIKAIHDYIRDRSGSPSIAQSVAQQIHTACRRLVDFPFRGKPRSDLGADVRTLTISQRAVIAYRVEEARVRILHIYYAGQDIGPENFVDES